MVEHYKHLRHHERLIDAKTTTKILRDIKKKTREEAAQKNILTKPTQGELHEDTL